MKIELLSPAGNPETGRAAVDAGADAVYIGAERFGAREAAGNTLEEIEGLARYAHGFGVKVYLTLNTLLFEDELEAARQTAWGAYEAGVDALIVQDMAYARMELPPVALHASTQTFNLAPERVRFLAEAGFSRIVLERGATLEQIRAIRAAIPAETELEAFVHGAICVCYSGQCYLGHAVCGRGGNRGGCAQPCRARYDLTDEKGNRLQKDKHLLSVGDLNLGDWLEDLIDAGVCSFKIEGRLKERDYVANNTAYYHQKLERLRVERSSFGEVSLDFEPNPGKSFSRGFTTYYLDGKRKGVSAKEARSVGERLGEVVRVDRDGSFQIRFAREGERVNNGDGICFLSRNGVLNGTQVNRSEGNLLFPNRTEGIEPGMTIYRNLDRSFRPESSRKIGIAVTFDVANGRLRAEDGEGNRAEVSFCSGDFEPAQNPGLAAENIRKALSKTGGTVFEAREVRLETPEDSTLPFIPAAELNRLRRELLEKLLETRLNAYERPEPFRLRQVGKGLIEPIDYRGNVVNSLAERFYREQGVKVLEFGIEVTNDLTGKELMRTPYCIRRELGICLKNHPDDRRQLFLENNGQKLALRFDCRACEMIIMSDCKGNR